MLVKFQILFVLILGLLLPNIVSANQTSSVLINSEASKAFQAHDYELALSELDKMAAQYPHDITIKRYQALSLQRLDRPQEAIEKYKEILLFSSEAVSIHYQIGVLYYQLGENDLATQHLREVVDIDSDSNYTNLANNYLGSIANQISDFVSPTKSKSKNKRWNMYMIAGISDDLGSRVAFDGEDKAGSRSSVYLSANYYFLRQGALTGSVGISGFKSKRNGESDGNNEFSQWGIRSALQVQHTFRDRPATSRVAINFKDLTFGSRPYSQGISGQVSSRVRFTDNTSTNFQMSYGEDKLEPLLEFDPDLALASRDLFNLGVDHTVYLKQRSVEVGGGLFVNRIDADKDNFNREGSGVKLFTRFTLPAKWQLRMSVKYREDSYPDSIGSANRDFNSTNYSAGLSHRFGKRTSMNLVYRNTETKSQSSLDDTNRSSIGLNLAYAY